MSQLIVLSAITADGPGTIKHISGAVLDCGGNIEESRMLAMGSEFAVLLLLSGNWHTLTKLEKALGELGKTRELSISIKKTTQRAGQDECIPYGLDVVCIDKPGTVYHLADFFSSRGIEIAEVATRKYVASTTGTPMSSIQMTVNIPGNAPIAQLRDDFLDPVRAPESRFNSRTR